VFAIGFMLRGYKGTKTISCGVVEESSQFRNERSSFETACQYMSLGAEELNGAEPSELVTRGIRL
jgi:hypothetical protein